MGSGQVDDGNGRESGEAARTQTERLATEIADAIVAGDLRPGTRLDEHALARQYGVSRTPVREALRQLGTTGLVEIRPRRGAVVAQVTAAQLTDLFVAMGEIEATCARLAALSMSPVERRRLSALNDAMAGLAEADDTVAYAEANTTFHGAIYAGAHNAILADFALGLRRRLQPYRQAQFRLRGRLQRSQAEHTAVTLALVGGRADETHAAMLHHVNLVETSLEDLLLTLQIGREPV